MKHLGIEHPRRPRRRVCCKFGSVLYLLGSHRFSPFEDIDVQRKFLSRWKICSQKSGDVWKNIDGELPVGWIKQSFMTEGAFVNWWHPPEVQTESCFAEHLSTFALPLWVWPWFEHDFCGCSPELQYSIRILWGVHLLEHVIKEFPTFVKSMPQPSDLMKRPVLTLHARNTLLKRCI